MAKHRRSGQTLDIQRSKKVVARVLPAVVTEGFPIGELDTRLAKGPQLSVTERQSMADDLNHVRTGLVTGDDPWAS